MAAAAAPAALVPLAEGAEQPAFKKVKLKLAPKPRKKRGPMPQKHEPKQCDECGEWLAGDRLLKKHKKKHTPMPACNSCLNCGFNPSWKTVLRNHCEAVCGPEYLPAICLPQSGKAKEKWDKLRAGLDEAIEQAADEAIEAILPDYDQPAQFRMARPPPACMPFIPNELPPRLAGMTELQHEQLCAEHTELAAQQWDHYEAWLRSKGYPVPESRADN